MVTWIQGQDPIAQHVLSRVVVDISCDIDLCSLGESILVKGLATSATDGDALNHSIQIRLVITNLLPYEPTAQRFELVFDRYGRFRVLLLSY